MAFVGPITWPSGPKIAALIGMSPMNDMMNTAITRPRRWFGTTDWIDVFTSEFVRAVLRISTSSAHDLLGGRLDVRLARARSLSTSAALFLVRELRREPRGWKSTPPRTSSGS